MLPASPQEDKLVRIDWLQVTNLADSIRGLHLATTRASYMVPPYDAEDDKFLESILWCSAICHSTKGALSGYFAGRYFKGWDYLLRSFLRYGASSSASTVGSISAISASGLYDLLLNGVEGATVRFDDLDRRAEILRSTATELCTTFEGRVDNILIAGRAESAGTRGYYAALDRLSAFNDPLRKKSSAFLMTVYYSSRWDFGTELDDIEPMVDYHRMRLLLRTGCIITDDSLGDALRENREVPISTEQAIRRAAREICLAVPRLVAWHMFDFDVALWTHARSCCRNSPLCVSRRVENDSFHHFVDVTTLARCVFEDWCPGSSNGAMRSLWEPQIETEDY